MGSSRPSKNEFHFKQFSVYQDKCAMKVGTDGVLLGAWVDVANDQWILDVGTGTGLIALMIAQRSSAIIDAIDVDEMAFEQSLSNFDQSPWRERLNSSLISLSDYSLQGKRYDHIVSNPPYFIDSLQSPNSRRTKARHTDSMPFDDFFRECKVMLHPNGRISIIIPHDIVDTIVRFAHYEELYPYRITRISTTTALPPKRVMIEFRQTKSTPIEESIVVEKERHKYTEEYVNLTKEYYL